MQEDDALAGKLAFVRPERRTLVERRIGVLKRHQAIADPTVADADRAAAELGMNRHSFYRLLRAWTASGDPRTVATAGRPRRATGHRPHPADEFVREAMRQMQPGKPVNRYVEAIMAAASDQGVEMMSRNALRGMLTELVVEAPVNGLFLDHCAIAIPVAGPEGRPTMPIATVLGNGGGILAAVLRMDPISPSSVVDVLDHAHSRNLLVPCEEPTRISADAGMGTGWRRLWSTMAGYGVHRTGEDWRVIWGGRLGRSLLVPKFLGLETRPRFVTLPASRRPIAVIDVLDEILPLERAQRFLDDRIDASRPDVSVALGKSPAETIAALRRLR